MKPNKPDRHEIEEEVAALGGLTLSALRDRWEQLFGSPPPRSLRRDFLIKACAYQIQVEAFGGLSPATKRRLRTIADSIRRGKPAASAALRIKPGTRLVRSWGGEVHTVTAVDGGFEYRGERFRSLSAIARAITGTNWNGLSFFGVMPNGKRTRKAAADAPASDASDGRAPARDRRARTSADATMPDAAGQLEGPTDA